MNKIGGAKVITPTASDYVESAIRHVGYSRHTSGFLPHSLLAIATRFINFIVPSVAERLFKKIMLEARDEAIKNGTYTPVKQI